MSWKLGPRMIPATICCIQQVRAYCVPRLEHDDDDDDDANNKDAGSTTFLVQVELENGMIGIGISTGGDAACYIVEKQLAKQCVEGEDPSNVELIWNKMFRQISVHYSERGVAMHAISAIDLAIWDVLGKLRKLPVYAMLGGKTKEKLSLYATTVRPDMAKRLGFQAAKMTMPFGPSEGSNGMTQNLNLIRKWRGTLGPDYPLMVQCNREKLTLPYAIELAKHCQGCNVKWMEESSSSPSSSLAPPRRNNQCDWYSKLKDQVPTISWAIGEHLYTRYDYRGLLEQESCSVIRLNLTTCGGLTEARKIVAMASAYDVNVIPTASSSVYGYHLQMAFSNCPIGEFVIHKSQEDSNSNRNGNHLKGYFGSIVLGEPLPSNGHISLSPDKFGFGIHLMGQQQQQQQQHGSSQLVFTRPYQHHPWSAAPAAAVGPREDQSRQAAAHNLVAAAKTTFSSISPTTTTTTTTTMQPTTAVISPPTTSQQQPPGHPSPLRGGGGDHHQNNKLIPIKRAMDRKVRTTNPLPCAATGTNAAATTTATTTNPSAYMTTTNNTQNQHKMVTGFRRFLSTETVQGLSYQESGDWCKKVGISLSGRKHERIHRLTEYLKSKPDGYKEY